MALSIWSNFNKFSPLIKSSKVHSVLIEASRPFFIQSCLERAKKSTRERKLKLLKKKKAQKAAQLLQKGPVVPYFKRKQTKSATSAATRRISDFDREEITDNVWFEDMFKFRVFSFEEAVKSLREVFHPTLYNNPSAPLNAYIELDMSTDKKTKFYEGFTNVVPVKHSFPQGDDRSILAFCKLAEQMDQATEAGATLAGGADTIKNIKKGKIMLPDFQFVIAHPNIMSELVAIRGLLRKKFPSLENGKLSINLPQLVKDLREGAKYDAKRDDFEMNYGWVDVTIGHLDMELAQLEDNFRLILNDVRTRGPRRTKNHENYSFITRCFITSPLCKERFKIPLQEYLEEEAILESDDEDEEQKIKK